jgi:mRNA interferase RelE/StbE
VSYRVVVASRAKTEVEAIPSPAFEAVEKRMLALGEDPRPPGCKKLKGEDRTWRIRSGKYRVLYQIDDSARIVTVIGVGHRKDVYR